MGDGSKTAFSFVMLLYSKAGRQQLYIISTSTHVHVLVAKTFQSMLIMPDDPHFRMIF